MALILSLETSTPVCSVALHDNGKLIAAAETHISQSAATKLAVLIDDVKKLAGIKMEELNAVAVTSGPGSYTGLRISTSTAKGLCYALNIPMISIGTLELLAFQVSKLTIEQFFLCPMIDARRMEVYCLVADRELKIKQAVQAKIIDETSFSEYLSERKVLFFGDGAEKCKTMITHSNAYFIENIFPAASQLGFLAHKKFELQQFEDLVHFEPFYLKDFVAKKASITL
ncbi:MAG TPA: tRNA (adenosine(37)-N6)-threonylcarbamoyltransferase complex dimerization subunit type 1 TsaB [Cyclobacteriaceae bacterium]|jgi:tRNA threonylcarbamoyladenosine biosynthesis protein TsaB|nr:tRNA (adenosine(37)-N6)-threonylcarbamoyltransferase complex dimerization subunit type 1 TsaB [Cyclobacteriaceae bacterium]